MMFVTHSKQLAQAILAATLCWYPVAVAVATNAPASKPAKPAPKSTAPAATTNVAPIEVPIPQSAFVVPKSRDDGVDPFFPLSTRLIVVAPTSSTNKPAPQAELVIKGLSGTPARPLVIINGVTFGLGDEIEVSGGRGRSRVRCIDINLKDETAIVEVNGEQRELRFKSGK